ncbi:MAG: hypothetical protein OXC93_05060 [Rhodospirillaceae bacterium]|nr:hypothetical protein [Rhodospirillaceae bacterium]
MTEACNNAVSIHLDKGGSIFSTASNSFSATPSAPTLRALKAAAFYRRRVVNAD